MLTKLWRNFNRDHEIEWRDAKIQKQAAEIEQLREENQYLKNQLEAAFERIKTLEARIIDLEEKLKTNSENSSKPPSSDPPSKKKKAKPNFGKPGKRKRGGQPGHEGKARKLNPPEDVDRFIVCKPESKCSCGGDVNIGQTPVERIQQFELPVKMAMLNEYQIFVGICDRCGCNHRGELPSGIPCGILGPRFMAATSIYSGKYHQSKRNIEEILNDIHGVDVSLGTVSNTESRVSDALEEAVEELKGHIKEQEIVNMDETGHKVAGKKAWMWLATTALVSVFLIRYSRGAKVAKELLGKTFSGILVSDRWSAYTWLAATKRQLCLAHLIRDFTKIAERSGASGAIGAVLLCMTYKMFHYWHLVRDGTMSRQQFQEIMRPLR
jgi:transposase